jgi:serpin B
MKKDGDERLIMSKFSLVLLFVALALYQVVAQPSSSTSSATMAASAINSIGIDLLHATARADANALLSPYSIETALTMTYAGADGDTKKEMARVLHLWGEAEQVASAFQTLQKQLDGIQQRSVAAATEMKKYGATNDPIALAVANRLFGEKRYVFRPEFLDLLKTKYGAPLQELDFVKDSAGATKTINGWVEQQTRERIRDLIPAGALDDLTRLVLVNAVYLKAPWAEHFWEGQTKPLPFHTSGAATVNVPMMEIQKSFGYGKFSGVTVVSVPYNGGEMQFLIILPDDTNGLAKIEARLTAEDLDKWAKLPSRDVLLQLPKFKIEPPTLALGEALQSLGMKTAFDVPSGSANFDRMAPRRPNDYLAISKVFHKTFISVDEKGTEAAAATAVAMMTLSAMPEPPKAVEVKVDHPFLFAIQHRASGACLFLGHLANLK